MSKGFNVRFVDLRRSGFDLVADVLSLALER